MADLNNDGIVDDKDVAIAKTTATKALSDAKDKAKEVARLEKEKELTGEVKGLLDDSKAATSGKEKLFYDSKV